MRNLSGPLAAMVPLLLGLSTAQADQTPHQLVDALSEISVKFQVLDNQAAEDGVDCSSLGADWGSCNTVNLTLTNGDTAIEGTGWALYFHSIRQILKLDSDQFTITHVTGDLHKLEPTDKFTGLAAGASITLPYIGEYWQLFETDFMPRWYAVAEGAEPKVLAATDTEDLSAFLAPISGDNWKRTAKDNNVLMTAQSRFEKNQHVSPLDATALRGQIIPSPMKLEVGAADLDIANGLDLSLSGLSEASLSVVREQMAGAGLNFSGEGAPVMGRVDADGFNDDLAKSGAYRLNITPEGVDVVGFDEAGLFYGLQSMLSVLPADGSLTLPHLSVEDAPRLAYRGAFLDVARNFHSKQAVLRLLDQMAAYKLNKFHFHLSDDEGWRIEVPGLPELTEVGSKRCHDPSETTCLLPQLGSGPNSDNFGSGHFTRPDYLEILAYAKARHIEVIPEIDMPAHARAAVVSMEARYQRYMSEGNEAAANEFRLVDPTDTSNTTSVQFYDRKSYLNPCLDSSKRFVTKVVSEIAAMHAEAGVPLTTWHFGGDEAKNIYLGGGYQDLNDELVPWKGTIDKSVQDKPWGKSQACQAMIDAGTIGDVDELASYFAVEVSKILKDNGISTMQAWQDGLKHASSAADFASDTVRVNFWDTLFWGGFDSAQDWANKGFEVILSNPDYVYLDMPYEVNPAERGYYWATRFSDEAKVFSFAPDNLPQNAETSVDRDGNHFTAKSDKQWPGATGLSAQLWSETVRTDAQMDSMIFPRLLSVAERAWHRAAWEQDYEPGREYVGGETNHVDHDALRADWNRFANLLGQRELARLDRGGVSYRLPVPGATVADGKLQANAALPGLTIEYSLDGGSTWQTYDAATPPAVATPVHLRTTSPDGTRTSRVEILQ
ncbi:beta-N-acetylhexosaminidase [Pseudovibrio sp. SPO723]|uniref:beta-N-acetylhexosaminidase n=1 Tax=Nesiotobacter zosterae TaxID=392721 RepID=UPI0029C31091|nr:beta-N-acetylhexosaminidase [Pseudovibrio sp. SPO723]MDX5593284.1 beta-N-acetylhexosaminidase [Pseudovibrio sp. SPO723]